MATLLKNTSFETSDFSDFDAETDADGDLNISKGGRFGDICARLLVNDTDQTDLQWNYSFGNLSVFYLAWWLKLPPFGGSGAQNMRFITATWQAYFYLYYAAGRPLLMTLEGYGNSDVGFTPSQVYDDDQWHHYEMRVQNSGGACWLKIDGKTESSFNSSGLNSSTVNRLRIGNSGAYGGPPTWEIKIDGIELWSDTPTNGHKYPEVPEYIARNRPLGGLGDLPSEELAKFV